MSGEPEVIVEQRGVAGILTLNRPRAINALTHTMVRIVRSALHQWRDNDTVRTIVITGAGERGLCAGGDVVGLHRAATTGDVESAAAFWRDEYRMNSEIASFPKPVVALQDGLVLGGGIGISAHASHRVVTERSRLGLPEVTIGFIPDVGATWLLSQAPGAAGTRIALTAESIGAADAIHVGMADSFVTSDRLTSLLSALEGEKPATAIAILASDPGPSALADDALAIDADFGHDTIAMILEALHDRGREELAGSIRQKSPTALSVTLESLRRARGARTLNDALETEFRVSMHALRAPDFAEGVRAQLIDKDRSPRWLPTDLDSVDEDQVAAFFTTPSVGDLELTASASKETA